MKRFYVTFSDAALAYVVYDRSRKVPENSTGHAIMWGTDHPDQSVAQSNCDSLNSMTNDQLQQQYGI